MSQKTCDSLDDLHFYDWSSLLLWNKFCIFNTRLIPERYITVLIATMFTMARTVTIVMTSLTLLDKLGKV